MESEQSKKQVEARNSLPEELRPIFDEFVGGYTYAATLRHPPPFVRWLPPGRTHWADAIRPYKWIRRFRGKDKKGTAPSPYESGPRIKSGMTKTQAGTHVLLLDSGSSPE